MRRRLPILIWLAWLGFGLGWLWLRTPVSTDLTFFLPRTPTLLDIILVQQMREVVGAGRRLTADVVAELMCDLYRGLVQDQAERFSEFFDHLLHDDSPLVFHCTAGKDRTGFAAALLLLALGVPRDLVMADYLLTNEVYRPPPLPASDTPPEALAVLWSVQPSVLEAALRAIDLDHGGVERYLSQRLGLGDAARAVLVRRFLQES